MDDEMYDRMYGGQFGDGLYGTDGYEDEEEDEREALIQRVAVCMGLLPGEGFDMDRFESACYMAGVDSESFSEEDLELLEEMM